MSAETALRALLAASPTLTALVGSRIAQNVVPQDEPLPLIVFSATHNPSYGIDNTLLADEVSFSVQCWANDGVSADAVADAVAAALTGTADVLSRETAYNEELKLDCTVLTVQWWTV